MGRPQGFKGIVWDGLMNGEPLRDVLDSADKRIKELVLDPIKQEYDAALRSGDTATANALERVAQKVNEL